MRFEYIRLKNYIGIFNGMELNEIVIRLDKCKYNKVVIKADNGSGKSTLMNAIHVFPDSNTNFISGEEAEKELVLFENGNRYKVLIRHGIKNNGDRDTTKAYIQKINAEGIIEELNPNGNVSSYKDIVSNELMLDPSFIELSQLGGENRGLVEKTPAERKKFVTSILHNLETYNNIHKNLSKKSSIFKSMINSLNSKMGSLGDEQKLLSSLKNMEDKINKLISTKEYKISELSNYKSKIHLLDPDGLIQNKYNDIYHNLNETNNTLKQVNDKINLSCTKLSISESDEDSILHLAKDINNRISDLDVDIRVEESKINMLLSEKDNEAKNIQSKSARLLALEHDNNYLDIQKEIQITECNLNSYINTINSLGIKDIDKISKEEYILGLETLKEIQECINVFKANMNIAIIEKAIDYINQSGYPDVVQLEKDIDIFKDNIKHLEMEYQQYHTLLIVSEKLNLRPTECTIDNCNFIKDAISAFNQEPKENLERLNIELRNLEESLRSANKTKEEYQELIPCINNIKNMFRVIDRSKDIISKLNVNSLIYNKTEIIQAIIGNYQFNEIDEIYQGINNSNIIDLYKLEKTKYNNLSNEYRIHENKITLINELNEEITILSLKVDSIVSQIDTVSTSVLSNKTELANFRLLVLEIELILQLYKESRELDVKKNTLISSFNNIKSDIIEIKECINKCTILENDIVNLNKEIQPSLNDRDTLNHSMKLIKEYQTELALYKDKFNKVDTIKRFSSPTTGIQTLFMGVYMNKTIELSNQLLSLLFNNKFSLGKFIINENEFRIPCNSATSLGNDDISSMSTSEKCMISMIISFALLFQSSTKFNILKLDEIDGGLDTNNRLQFLIVLDQLLEMLSVEQVFIISHNNELDLDNCDVILFKNSSNEEVGGNVIFNYNDNI